MMKKQTITFQDTTLKVIEDWRKAQNTIPSFNEAVNVMLQRYGAILKLEELKQGVENE